MEVFLEVEDDLVRSPLEAVALKVAEVTVEEPQLGQSVLEDMKVEAEVAVV